MIPHQSGTIERNVHNDADQAAAFIHEMASELARQAQASSLQTLAYLLQMAALEAQACRTKNARVSAPAPQGMCNPR